MFDQLMMKVLHKGSLVHRNDGPLHNGRQPKTLYGLVVTAFPSFLDYNLASFKV